MKNFHPKQNIYQKLNINLHKIQNNYIPNKNYYNNLNIPIAPIGETDSNQINKKNILHKVPTVPNFNYLNHNKIILPKPIIPKQNIMQNNAKVNDTHKNLNNKNKKALITTEIQSYNIFGPLKPLNPTIIEKKITKSYNINIIYYNENLNDVENTQNCSYFKYNLEGIFYGINNFNLFKYISLNIQKKEKYFILISSGSCAEKIFSFCYKYNIRKIYKYYIYCMNKSDYEDLIEKYDRLKGIFITFEDLKNCIFTNPTIINNKIKSSNLIFLSDYNDSLIRFHFEIVKKYSLYKLMKSNNLNNSKFMELVKNKFPYYEKLAKELIYKDDESMIKFFKEEKKEPEEELRKIFNHNHNIYNYISNYTVESFYYRYINLFLRNGDLKSFRLLSNHISKFIYHLYEYRKTQTQITSSTLYRSMYISREELKLYKHSIGRIICYPSFTSTSIMEYGYSPFLQPPNSKLVKLIIQQNNSPLIINIRDLSEHKYEEEYLCVPFSFFKIDKVLIQKGCSYIYLTALNSEKPLEEMYLKFMENETDNLDPEGLDLLQLTNNNTTLIINPTLKSLIHNGWFFNY